VEVAGSQDDRGVDNHHLQSLGDEGPGQGFGHGLAVAVKEAPRGQVERMLLRQQRARGRTPRAARELVSDHPVQAQITGHGEDVAGAFHVDP